MFYDSVFTFSERQTLLRLAEVSYLVKLDCPDFLKRSKHAIEIRHTVTNRAYEGRSSVSGTITTTIVPRIHSRDVRRVVKRIKESQDISAARALADLFDLGLGVPLQKDIALYLRSYSEAADKKGTGIKYISKLISQYHKMYRRSMAGSKWFMPAKYTANMLHMQQFIHLKENGYKNKLKVPDGIPVVLVYQNTNFETSTFSLCDAFMISPTGYPVPMAQIAMRNEFKAAPREFSSKALSGKGMYSMVMGMLFWDDMPAVDGFKELMEIDADPYLCLLDDEKYHAYRSDAYIEALNRRDLFLKEIDQNNELLAEYAAAPSLTEKQKRKAEEARRFLKTKGTFFREFTNIERKEESRASKKFAVARARFVAIDCGTIADRTTYRAVGTTLDKVQTILGKWGFTRLSEVKSKKSELTYSTEKATRTWSL